MGFSRLLQLDLQNQSELKKIEQIIHSGDQILRLVEDLLDLGIIEKNKFPINSEEVLLNKLIEKSFVQVQESAKEKKYA